MPNMIHKQQFDLQNPETGPNDVAIYRLKLPKHSQILAIREKAISFAGLDAGSRVFVWYSFPEGTEEVVDVKFYVVCTGQSYAGPAFKDSADTYSEREPVYLATTFHNHKSIVLHWFVQQHPCVTKAP